MRHVTNAWRDMVRDVIEHPWLHNIPWFSSIPSCMVLALDELRVQFVRQRKNMVEKNSSRTPLVADKRAVTLTPVVALDGAGVGVHIIFQGKTRRCLPENSQGDHRIWLHFSDCRMQTQRYVCLLPLLLMFVVLEHFESCWMQ